jgi:hypothetical protein
VPRGPVAVVLAVATLLVPGGCGSRATPAGRTIEVQGRSVTASSLREAVSGLCIARARLETDALAARSAFYDLAHQGLHTIAAAVQGVDRDAATTLLQAKAVVEADLARYPFPTSLRTDLDRLIDATRRALAALSIPTEPC